MGGGEGKNNPDPTLFHVASVHYGKNVIKHKSEMFSMLLLQAKVPYWRMVSRNDGGF
jgi:hypothetical protein